MGTITVVCVAVSIVCLFAAVLVAIWWLLGDSPPTLTCCFPVYMGTFVDVEVDGRTVRTFDTRPCGNPACVQIGGVHYCSAHGSILMRCNNRKSK